MYAFFRTQWLSQCVADHALEFSRSTADSGDASRTGAANRCVNAPSEVALSGDHSSLTGEQPGAGFTWRQDETPLELWSVAQAFRSRLGDLFWNRVHNRCPVGGPARWEL